jgi:hypothetical protein
MPIKTKPLTDSEFIQQALNHYFHHANEKLAGQLGDIERKNFEFIRKRSLELITQLEAGDMQVCEKPKTPKQQAQEFIFQLEKPNWSVRDLFTVNRNAALMSFLNYLERKKPNWSKEQLYEEVNTFFY